MILALSSLSKEIDELTNEAEGRFYNPILYYGEGLNLVDETIDEGEAILSLSRLLPILQQVKDLLGF